MHELKETLIPNKKEGQTLEKRMMGRPAAKYRSLERKRRPNRALATEETARDHGEIVAGRWDSPAGSNPVLSSSEKGSVKLDGLSKPPKSVP